MIEPRPFDQLGCFTNDWLDAHYHFSFADYHDDARMGEGSLRVWNDDTIHPHTGFPMHGHRDMEIITYIREGAITHQDSLGNRGVTEAGQVQVMSAGKGILHSEANEGDIPTRLFQIWLLPRARGLAPRWETKPFPRNHGRLEIMASGRAEDGAPLINQDARILAATLETEDELSHDAQGRTLYLVPARGSVTVNGVTVGERWGAVIRDEDRVVITAREPAEIVIVEV